jgi:integrase
MASVQTRSNPSGSSSYRLHYRWRGKQETITYDDPADADRWCRIFNAAGVEAGLRLYAAELAPAEPVPPKRTTVRDIVEHHIDHLTGVTDGTRENYRREAGWDIYPTLGDLPITSIGDDKAKAWVNSLSAKDRQVNGIVRGPLSGKTIKNRHGLLSAAFATAVRRKLVDANPFHGLKLPESDVEEMAFLSAEEWWIVHDSLNPHYQPLASVLVGTGLRWGEATALRVRDVALGKGQLQVAQAWKSDGGGRRVLGPPKSVAGRRHVPFQDEVAAVLEPLIAGRAPDELVFRNTQGRRVQSDSFHSSPWPVAMKRAREAGLQKHVRPHDLRHTFASWQLESGEVSLFSLAVIIGHDDLKLLRKRYGHLLPEAAGAVARVAGAKLTRPKPALRSVAG